MSERDKRLLIYLGALCILAAAYFLVGRPYMDKIEQLESQKMTLTSELSEKQLAYSRNGEYQKDIDEANKKIDEIIAKFPEDNTDEKSIMFAVNAEKDVPIWFVQMKFAESTQSLVNGEETETMAEESIENTQEQVNEIENETGDATDSSTEIEAGDNSTEQIAGVSDLVGRSTDLGISFIVSYPGFKNFLAYIRDYEDRMVIKNIDAAYDEKTGLVSGNLSLSQYAILGPGRVLPDVETEVEKIGTENIFAAYNSGESFYDTLVNLIDAMSSGITNEPAVENAVADFFLTVSKVSDNTEGKTIGKTNDVPGTSYIISNEDSKEDVYIEFKGSEGDYVAVYSIGDESKEESFEKSEGDSIHFRIISSDRGLEDNSEADVHVTNNTDRSVIVRIEGEDNDSPRIDVVEKNGDVTVGH